MRMYLYYHTRSRDRIPYNDAHVRCIVAVLCIFLLFFRLLVKLLKKKKENKRKNSVQVVNTVQKSISIVLLFCYCRKQLTLFIQNKNLLYKIFKNKSHCQSIVIFLFELQEIFIPYVDENGCKAIRRFLTVKCNIPFYNEIFIIAAATTYIYNTFYYY